MIEAGIAFGGNIPADQPARVYRFANRVPLQYQQSACSSFKSVMEMNWKNYSLQQPRGALPVGPMVVMIHMASVWVPFTSESKEAIADYDAIRKEMGLALKECGRKLGTYIRKRQKMKRAGERRDIFKRYIGEVATACGKLTDEDPARIYQHLLAVAERKTFEMDQQLDEEGRVVKDTDRLAKDEAVYIRETVEDVDEPDTTKSDDDGPTGDTLFGEDSTPARTSKKKTKKKVKKKTKRTTRKSGS